MILKIKCNRIWCIAVVVLVIATITAYCFNSLSPIKPRASEAYNVLGEAVPINKADVDNIRGVWVPYMSLETKEHTEKSFKKNFDKIINTAKENKINTLIVHIRPFSDALYTSKIYPSSHIVTGKQGAEMNFDPLKYMIDQSHKNNLKFHGWINPYRICTEDTPKELSQKGVLSKLDSNDILEYDGGKYINPASTKGQKLIIDGVKEVVKNYDVDGIQFDDYFYPAAETAIDADSYLNYKEGLDAECIPLTQIQWRKSNVNMLVSSVYSSIKAIKSHVIFGISPQGNINNCLNIGADIYTWCSTKGYVDYICPQIYVNFKHSVLPFDTMLKQWQDAMQNSTVPLCVGLALYKAGSNDDEGTWREDNDILMKEVEYCKKQNINGFMIYHIDYFNNDNASKEVENVLAVL